MVFKRMKKRNLISNIILIVVFLAFLLLIEENKKLQLKLKGF